ncbi:unnamed protein product [Danaus chrysippus]|uniref:(African queen) hypothetical protein n=1 Tax=Danaus chrysippus TaxID=151541 RepID=A0A8J2R1L9_9NEOP|nr:unnamed protein product [Danaus chrysippus]
MLGSLGTFEYGLRAGKLHTLDYGLRVECARMFEYVLHTSRAHMLGSLGTFEYGLRAGKLHTLDYGLRVECARMFEYVLHTNETNVDELNDDEETTHADRANPTAALSRPLLDDVAETNSPTSLVAGSSGVSHEICAEDDSTSGEAV